MVFGAIIFFGIIFQTSGFYITSVSMVVLALLLWIFSLSSGNAKGPIHATTFLFPTGFFFYALFMAFLEDTTEEIRHDRAGWFQRNQRNLVLALQSYREHHGHFPPAVVFGPKGEPLHSWRVLILPHLGEDELYKRFRLNEPWDSKENIKLLPEIPSVFRPNDRDIANSPDSTFHQALVGPGAEFLREGAFDFKNDLPGEEDQVIVLLEAFEPVPWTSPRDLTFDAMGTTPPLGRPQKSRIGRLTWVGKQVQPRWYSAAWVGGELDECAEFFDNPPDWMALRDWISRLREKRLKE